MSDLKSLIRELHRRSVWQVLGLYLMGSWGAIQVVDMVVETASLPDWLPGMALVLLIIGLPVVLATALLQQGMSRGAEAGEGGSGSDGSEGADAVVTDAPSPRPAQVGGAGGLFTWRFAIMGGVGAFALWGLIATFLLFQRGANDGLGEQIDQLAVAVLPFASAGTAADDESFALGIHDDLLTQLAGIGSLRVISRTSVMRYKDNPGNLRDIARELGAHVILEGSVQRAGDQIHMNAQLIDTREDEGHLWAESFDRRLTVENIFLIQRELAERIAGAMSATLTPEEVEEVGSAPTDNLEAYTLYLQANNYFASGPRSDDFDVALDLYRQVVEMDPGFGQAYARLALALASEAEVTRESAGLLEEARRNAELALALDEDNAEAHLALGQYHYTGFRDYEAALREISAARAAGLNSAELHHNLGAAQRRMGDFAGSIASFEEAVSLNPLASHYYEDLGSTYNGAGRMAEGIERLEKAITLAPDVGSPFNFLFWAMLAEDGNTTRARDLLPDFEAVIGQRPRGLWLWVHWYERDFEAVAAVSDSMGGSVLGAEALERMGDPAGAREMRERALEWRRENLAEIVAAEEIRMARDEAFERVYLARLLAELGQTAEVAQQVDTALEILPVSRDAMDGPDLVVDAAIAMMKAGDMDRAVELLTLVVGGVSSFTPGYIAMDPIWDPLREHPGFQALVSR